MMGRTALEIERECVDPHAVTPVYADELGDIEIVGQLARLSWCTDIKVPGLVMPRLLVVQRLLIPVHALFAGRPRVDKAMRQVLGAHAVPGALH